jgi:flagellar hook-length control protein FliK
MTQQQRPAPQGGEQHNQPQPDSSAINKLLNLLLRQAEGGLARIQLNQLNSLPQEDSGNKLVWQFELPLRHADEFDSFKLRIEREDSHNELAQHRWRITINFDLDPLGPIQAQISLQGEEVSTLFMTELKESAELIDQHLPVLNQAFSQAGLKVGHLAAQKTGGLATEEPQLPPHPLLDEQA